MTLINFLILYFNILSFEGVTSDINEWVLKKNENNIKVYLRKNAKNTSEYLAETVVSSDIDSILKFILDFDNSYKWMYRLEDSKILEKSNDTLFYVYFKMEMGWPLKKRDLVSDVKILSEDNRVTVNLTSTPGYIPLDKNLIRILDSKSTWILSKIDSNKTKVTLQSYAEIDKIPSFVVDMFILDGPLHSMKNLRKNF